MIKRTYHRPEPIETPEQGLRRTILVSLLLHGVVIALFVGDFLPRRHIDVRPVYVVDLMNLPVKNPQAGRPDAGPKTEAPAKLPEPAAKAEPAAQPEPSKPPKAETVKLPEPVKPSRPEKPAKPEPKPTPKAAAKPATEAPPKPEPKAAKTAKNQDAEASLNAKLEMMRLKQELAMLAGKDTRGAKGSDVPVGMQDGKGSEAGSSYDAWIHEYLKKAWALSKYQVGRRDLEATVKLVFDAQGRLLDYKFVKKSGEERFDDSVLRAVLQLKELPNAPDARMEKIVVFNLKELTD